MIKRLSFFAHFPFLSFLYKDELAEKLRGRKLLVDTRTS